MSYIYPYGYKPDPVFHWQYDLVDYANDLFYGVELETDNGYVNSFSNALHAIDPNEREFYQKHDGSLRLGVEIVTHPCTLYYHLKEFPWDKICELAKDYSMQSDTTTTCGLHVHVSRKGLGEDQEEQDFTIAKLLLLFSAFWPQIVKFTRRQKKELNRWAKKSPKKFFADEGEERLKDKASTVRYEGRYCAINLRNANTVEFRVFKGTLDPDIIKATLQFLDNIIHYAKDADLIKIQKSNWKDIVNYNVYPELTEYLNGLGLNVSKKAKVVRPDINIVHIKSGVPFVVNGEINPDAYTITKMKFVNFQNAYPNFREYERGDVVAVIDPRGKKVQKINSITSITAAGSVHVNYERAISPKRIALVMFEPGKFNEGDFNNNKCWFTKTDGKWEWIRPVYDIAGNRGWWVSRRIGTFSFITYVCDRIDNPYNVTIGSKVMIDGKEWTVDYVVNGGSMRVSCGGSYTYIFSRNVGDDWVPIE